MKSLSALTVRRLTKLANFMAGIKDDEARGHFSMGSFFSTQRFNPPAGVLTLKRLHECDTLACAFGYATVVPEFRRAGLRATFNSSGDWGVTLRGNYHAMGTIGCAMDFFGLTEAQAWHLFDNVPGIFTPRDWARRCRRFLKNPSLVKDD